MAAVSADQMREIDRIAIGSGLSLLQMMENAGIRLSEVAWSFFALRPEQPVVVIAGGGNNGGGALAAARHLANRGADVAVVLDRPPSDLTAAGRRQLDVLEQAPVSVSLEPPSTSGPIIDGLIGYGLRGNPQGPTSVLIEWANSSRVPVCSLDLPSGLDANTGVPGTPCLQASVTLTLALPKAGLFSPSARAVTGTLFLADISIPEGVYGSLSLERPDAFSVSPILEISG